MDTYNWVPDSCELENKNGAFEVNLYLLCTPESPSNQFVISTSGKDDDKHNEETQTTKSDQDKCSLWPSKNGIIILSIIEFIFFIVDNSYKDINSEFPFGPTGQFFVYDPSKRRQLWRYFTYMFVHKDYFHLGVNLIGQILLGLPLEIANNSCRILTIYFAGVVAGSLCTSITDPTSVLAGASGGVYSLFAAYIATFILDWKELHCPAGKVIYFTTAACGDIGISLYVYFKTEMGKHIAYASHFSGAVAGLLVGILVLKKLRVTKADYLIWWTAVALYAILMLIGIVCNIIQSTE